MFERRLHPVSGPARPGVPADPGDGVDPVTARLQRLAGHPAGAGTDLAWLAGLNPGRLDGQQRVLALQAWERHAAWVAARTQTAVVAVADSAPGPAADDWGREEVAAALRLSPATAHRR